MSGAAEPALVAARRSVVAREDGSGIAVSFNRANGRSARAFASEPPHRMRSSRPGRRAMRIDISFLPAYAAAFMLAFARVSAMVMLLPGLGETNIPVRIK